MNIQPRLALAMYPVQQSQRGIQPESLRFGITKSPKEDLWAKAKAEHDEKKIPGYLNLLGAAVAGTIYAALFILVPISSRVSLVSIYCKSKFASEKDKNDPYSGIVKDMTFKEFAKAFFNGGMHADDAVYKNRLTPEERLADEEAVGSSHQASSAWHKHVYEQRIHEAQELDHAIHQTLLPSLPESLRNLDAIGPELTEEGIQYLYPHIPSKQVMLEQYGKLPSNELALGIIYLGRGIERQAEYHIDKETGEDRHQKTSPLPPITVNPDGTCSMNGQVFITPEQAKLTISGAELSEVTRENMLKWIIEAARVKPTLFEQFEAKPLDNGSVLLTSVAQDRSKMALKDLWK